MNFILRGSSDRDEELDMMFMKNNISEGIFSPKGKRTNPVIENFKGPRGKKKDQQKIFDTIKNKAEEIREMVVIFF